MAVSRGIYFRWFNIEADVTGVLTKVYYYWHNPAGGEIAANITLFYGQSIEQRIAQSKAAAPESVDGFEPHPEYGFGSAKLKELFVARNPDNTLSFYADGTGNLTLDLIAGFNTPAYPNGLKEMVSQGGPWPRDGLFPGAKPYGSYFTGVPDGNYTVRWADEDGAFRVFAFTLKRAQAFTRLYPGLSTGTTPTTPTTPTDPNLPPTNLVYPSKGNLVGYVQV